MTGPTMTTVGRKKLSMSKQNELNSLVDALIKHSTLNTTNLNEQFKQYQDMYSVLERIRKLESELKLKTNNGKSRQANIETFCRWAKENGCEFDGIKISEFSGFELGLEATRDFKEGETFVTVPKKLIVSATADSMIHDVMKDIPVMMKHNLSNLVLALLLIAERFQPNSVSKPYLDVLPDRYSTVMYFTPAEMAELKGTSAYGPAMSQCKNIARQYGFIKKFIQSETSLLKDNFTYDLYCWAASTVMTRQNIIPVDIEDASAEGSDSTEPGLRPVLIPLWDMANHINGQITTGYNEQLQRVESQTLKPFAKGEQIFIYYGNRNNADFLVHNGFVYPENTNTTVMIQLGLNTGEELFDLRKQLLKKLNLPITGDFSVNRGPDCISAELLGFARVFNMSKEQLTGWIEKEECAIKTLLDPEGVDLEDSLKEKVWKFLSIRLQLMMRMSGTSLEQDEALLANQGQKGTPKLGHIKAMLVQYRIIEKRILTDAVEYCKKKEEAVAK